MRPLKTLQAWHYKARLKGWTDVKDLYLRGHSMSWVRLEFLERVADYARNCRGPILECGSGLTTEVLRRYAPKCPLVSLEQHIGWAMKTGATHAPIDPDTGWYRYKPEAVEYHLVVVDGPDGWDRAGFLVESGFAPGCRILIDDTHNRWEGCRVVSQTQFWLAHKLKGVERHGNNDYNHTVVTLC